MTKHTPGPWRVSDIFYHGKPEIEAGGAPVARVTRSVKSGTTTAYVANARLIASAPELLAAVNRLLNTMNHVYVSQPTHEDLPAWAEAQQQARAVIAKATGESQ